MVLFFYGPNTFASRQKLRDLVERYKKSSGSDFGLEKFDGSTTDAEPIVAAITSQPFLAKHRLIVIEDLLSNKATAVAVLPALERVPSENVVVFYEHQPDERTKAFKELKKLAKTIKFDELKPHQLINWLRKTAREFGGELDSATAKYLIEQAGTEQWNLYHQTHKLVNYNPKINRDSIDELVEPVFEKTIFDLVEALTRGNTKAAMQYYQGLRVNKAEPLYILSMIGWGLRNLLLVKSADKKSGSEIAKQAGMNPFVVNKSQSAAAKVELNAIAEAYKKVVDTDYRLKTSAGEPDILMEQLLTNVTQQLKV